MDTENQRIYDRMTLYRLMQANPTWSPAHLAEVVGRSDGVEAIAAWYREMVGESRLIDVRAGQAFVAEYVAAQEERYREQHGSAPKRRLREDWRSAARVLWAREAQGAMQGGGRERVAVAAD